MLVFEKYLSDKPIKKINCYAYKLKYPFSPEDNKDDIIKVYRGVCRNLNKRINDNMYNAIDEESIIFTTKPIEDVHLFGMYRNKSYELQYQNIQEMDFIVNHRVYEHYVKGKILDQLKKVTIERSGNSVKKYIIWDNVIQTEWIKSFDVNADLYFQHYGKNNLFILKREFDIDVEMLPDGVVSIIINSKSVFQGKKSLDYYNEKDMIGMHVKYKWSGISFSQSGIVQSVGPETVVDPVINNIISLKEYYLDKYKTNNKVISQINKMPNNTKVVRIMNNKGEEIIYPIVALMPSFSYERIKSLDPYFLSNKAHRPVINRNMKIRLFENKQLLYDIGKIEELQGVSFLSTPCNIENNGYRGGKINLPQLYCKGFSNEDVIISAIRGRKDVFNYKFFKNPEIGSKFIIGFLYPTDIRESLLDAIRLLFSPKKGLIQFMPEIKSNGSIPVETHTVEYFASDDKTILKHKLSEFSRKNVDIVFCVSDTDEDSSYNPIKQILSSFMIPSQMLTRRITLQLAKEYNNQKKFNNISVENNYIAYNILLQICGKLGGIPYVLKDMPGDVDCFVGLDVSTVEAGIHYPAGSVSFGRYGDLLGYYHTICPQKGEKITDEILEEIFSNVINTYYSKYGKNPKHIVIHRDGFSREKDAWYNGYFTKHGIKYSIFEIKKYVSIRMAEIVDKNHTFDPSIGSYAIKENTAVLVTTTGGKQGAPRPIRIDKVTGDIDMETAVKQVLYLAQIHVGTLNVTRLPITTMYADKVCKSVTRVPVGYLEHRLFFL